MGLRRAGRALAGWLEKQRLERASNPGRLYARAHASHRLGAQKNSPSVARFWPGSSSAHGHMNSPDTLGSSYATSHEGQSPDDRIVPRLRRRLPPRWGPAMIEIDVVFEGGSSAPTGSSSARPGEQLLRLGQRTYM